MKAKSSADPRHLLAADVAAWIAVYGSVSGLVDFNTYAFASLAAATRCRPHSLPLRRKPVTSADEAPGS